MFVAAELGCAAREYSGGFDMQRRTRHHTVTSEIWHLRHRHETLTAEGVGATVHHSGADENRWP